MKKILTFLSVFILIFSFVDAQTSRKDTKKFEEALEYLSSGKYKIADNLIGELLSEDKNNLEYAFYKGICEINTNNEDKAIEHFDKIIDDYKKTKKEKGVTKAAFFYKAKAYHNLYMFDEETETLNKLNSFDLKDEEKKQLKEAIDHANNAKELFFDFKPIIVTRLDILNSGYDDHTPIPTSEGDKIYFTSKRPGGISGDALSEEGKYFEDIWFWDGKDEPVNIGKPVNSMGHDATGGLSLDGKTLFIYRAKDGKGGDLYYSVLNSDGKWEDPVKLGKNINKRKYTERHAALSPDGKKLYFSSNIKGGKGGRDIWVSELQEDGTWGKPANLNINTEFDEEAPYMLSDGITFYFSSKGYKNMGGYDIFKCMLQNDGTFSRPQNIGFPINTVEDDVFFFPVSSEDVAYFTRRKTDNAEIYKTMFPNNALIVESSVRGKEYEKDLYAMNSDINIIDVNSENTPDAYTLKIETAKYKSVIVPDKDYKFVYETEGYVFDTKDISIKDMFGKKTIEETPILVKIEEGKTEKHKNMSFKDNSPELINYTKKELDIIAEYLIKYDNLVVNLSTEDYAKESNKLAENRKRKAVEYLRNKGVSAEKIYTDLSPNDIPGNKMEYTIYDTESVKKAIAEKEARKKDVVPEYFVIQIENIFFDFDKKYMKIHKNEKIDLLCKYLNDNPEAKVAIIGYTDAVGKEAYNNTLSKKRAATVKDYMIRQNVNENQIEILGYGEDNPVTLNKKDGKYYEPSKKYNRRVEFRVLAQGKPELKIIQFKNIPQEYKNPDYNPDYKK